MTVQSKRLDGLSVYTSYQCKLTITMKDDWLTQLPYTFAQTARVLNFKSLSASKYDVDLLL